MKKTFRGTVKGGLVAGALALMAFGSQPLFAGTFEFHGYARSGEMFAPGLYTTGGQVDEHWIGRLGNEGNQNYLESELVNSDTASDGSWAKYHVMLVINSNGFNGTGAFSNYPGSYGNGGVGDILMRQAYVEMGGFAWDPKAVYWIGEKYIGRDDIHILDFFWRDFSGEGIGVTNAFNGMVDLSVESTGSANGANGENYLPFNTDLRVRPFMTMGIDALSSMELEAAVSYQYGISGGNSKQSDYGYQFAAVYPFPKFFGIADGFSKAAIQLGFANDGTDWNLGHAYTGAAASKDAVAVRFIVFGEANNILPNLDLMPAIVYTTAKSGVTNEDQASKLGIALRPVYKFNNNLSLQVEGGYSHTFGTNSVTWYQGNSINTTADYYKVTVAPTLSLNSGFWGRPQLRMFYTFVGGDVYVGTAAGTTTVNSFHADNANSSNTESRFGFQFETWF
jgi:maltoporin